jgi:hypothetical protein
VAFYVRGGVITTRNTVAKTTTAQQVVPGPEASFITGSVFNQ